VTLLNDVAQASCLPFVDAHLQARRLRYGEAGLFVPPGTVVLLAVLLRVLQPMGW